MEIDCYDERLHTPSSPVFLSPQAQVMAGLISRTAPPLPSYLRANIKCRNSSHVNISLDISFLFLWPSCTACQIPLSFTISQSLCKLMSVELVMPSNHLILCRLLSPPALSLSQHQGLFQ